MLVKDSNDIPVIQSNKAMDKAQEIANKILRTTPHLIRRNVILVVIQLNHPLELPSDSVFRNNGNQTAPTYNPNPTTQMPVIKRPETTKDTKKKQSTLGKSQ